MDKVKILFVVISVFLLIGATGCQPPSGRKEESREIDYSGTEGLVMDFITPENVWKGVEFDIIVDVQNKGLMDVKSGTVCFSGITTELFVKADGCQDLIREEGSLGGRLSFPDGEIRSYTWSDYSFVGGYMGDVEHSLLAKVCYSAETMARPIACVKSVGRDEESVCEGGKLDITGSAVSSFDFGSMRKGGIVSGKGQGGPVAITNVYEDIIPKEGNVDLRFEITVANVGDGEVINLDSLGEGDKCNFEREDKNKVKISAKLVGYESALDCKDKTVKLSQNGEGTVLCKGSISVEEGESFPLPLNIKLNYGYLSTTKGGFTIKKDIYWEE